MEKSLHLTDEPLPIRLDRTVVYQCAWLNLYRDKVALPNGHILEQYHLVDCPPSVAIIVENDLGRILMERISRYPIGTITWELPAGGIEGNESAIAAAEREVLEETGYATQDHREVYQFHPLNGLSNLLVHIVACHAGPRTGHLDENEVAAIRWFNKTELQEMIRCKEITDAFALVGLLLHFGRYLVP